MSTQLKKVCKFSKSEKPHDAASHHFQNIFLELSSATYAGMHIERGREKYSFLKEKAEQFVTQIKTCLFEDVKDFNWLKHEAIGLISFI